MSIQIKIKDCAVQYDDKINRYLGFLSPLEIIQILNHGISLGPNPRYPKRTKIVTSIIKTLSNKEDRSLFKYMTKGSLISCKIALHDQKENIYDLTFEKDNIFGILDGGHNFLAMASYIIEVCMQSKYESLNDKESRSICKATAAEKIKNWENLQSILRDYGKDVETIILSSQIESSSKARKLKEKLSFYFPVELLTPSTNKTNEKAFFDLIHKISAARNTNQQLKNSAISLHTGSYSVLQEIFNGTQINELVQWKYGDNTRCIEASRLAVLTSAVFYRLNESFINDGRPQTVWESLNSRIKNYLNDSSYCLPSIQINSIYQAIKTCEAAYSDVVNVLMNFDEQNECRQAVFNSLKVVRNFPYLWDVIESKFEDYFNKAATDKSYEDLIKDPNGNVKFNKQGDFTRFHYIDVSSQHKLPQTGFVSPLFNAIAISSIKYNQATGCIVDRVDFNDIIEEIDSGRSELMDKLMTSYVEKMKLYNYYPREVGINKIIYDDLKKIVNNYYDDQGY